MTDLLVKLYDEFPTPDLDRLAAEGVAIRRGMAPEARAVERRVAEAFGAGWGSEVAIAFGRQPIGCFVAAAGHALLGFACYDATARGFFGPTGVFEPAGGRGIGRALLIACLNDMRSQGYGYAIIGGAGPVGYYEKAVGAVPIAGSDPGIYPPLVR